MRDLRHILILVYRREYEGAEKYLCSAVCNAILRTARISADRHQGCPSLYAATRGDSYPRTRAFYYHNNILTNNEVWCLACSLI